MSDDIGRQRAANHMQMICKYDGKMAADDVADVVLSAAVFFVIFGTEHTDSDEDAKELCDTVIRRRRQRPRHYWVHPVNCKIVK